MARPAAALGLGVPQLTVKPFSDSGKNRAREGQVRAQVSFLPERLQLSMAFEAPELLWHFTGSVQSFPFQWRRPWPAGQVH